MKNYYYGIVAILFCFTLQTINAQITLSSSNNWSIGETYTYNLVDGANFDPGADGANVTWDFGSIVSFSTTSTEALAVSDLSNGALFPDANVGFDDLSSDSESYYLTTNDGQSFYGATGTAGGGIMAIVTYDDPQDLVRYPMTFGDDFSDDFSGTVTSTVSFFRSGTAEVNADAYGTLVTPVGTFDNVLRVVTQMNYSDVFSGSTLVSYEETRYSWYDSNSDFPLLIYTEILSNGTLTTTSFTYLDASVSNTNAALATDVQLSVFPNPTAEQLFIEYTLTEKASVSVSILNLVGQQVASVLSEETQFAGHQALNPDLSHLPNGTYFVKLKIGEEIGVHKISIQR